MYFTADVRLGWLSTILVFSIIVMPLGPGAGEPQQPAPSPAVAERATLVVLNDSGKVLFSSRQKVEDNGETLVSLARHEYQRVSMAPGRHVLRLPHRRNPQVVLEAEAGRTYYLLVAYKPEKSYFAPFLGSPFVLAEIPEDIARQGWAELVNRNRKSFAVIGEGFRPGERVQIRSTDGYDPKEWSVTADESGSVFAGIDHGRSGGTAMFTAAGEGCSVTLTYEFGKKAKGPM